VLALSNGKRIVRPNVVAEVAVGKRLPVEICDTSKKTATNNRKFSLHLQAFAENARSAAMVVRGVFLFRENP